MNRTARRAAAGILALSACEGTTGSETAAVDSGLPSPAQAACMSAVAEETGNGNVTVMSQTASLGRNEVIIGVGADRTPWRCLAANDGSIAEVTPMLDEGAL